MPDPDQIAELSRAVRHLSGQMEELPDRLQRKLMPHLYIESRVPNATTPEKAEERKRLERAERTAELSMRFAGIASVAALLTAIGTLVAVLVF